jgi:hypothetical protein
MDGWGCFAKELAANAAELVFKEQVCTFTVRKAITKLSKV